MATVVPIPKKGDRASPSSYRPVSLTSQLSKLFEHVLVSDMHYHLDTHQLLSPLQHGFRAKRSCATAIVSALHQWAQPLDDLIPIDSLFFDFSKAFDRVPHRRLCAKLALFGFHQDTINWIRNFLLDRTFRVRVDSSFSSSKRVLSGVPQGSVLGPLLFLLYIDDVQRCFSPGTIACLYADDLMISRAIHSQQQAYILQGDAIRISDWTKVWCMPLNLAKSCSMRISLRRAPEQTNFVYSIGNVALEQVTSFKYLGVILTNELVWYEHVQAITTKANKALGFLRRQFYGAPESLKLKLYKTLVRPILESASSSWDVHYQYDIDSIERIQNRGARFTTGDYSWDSSVSQMKLKLKLGSLVSRRCVARVNLLRKVCLRKLAVPGLPHIDPSNLRASQRFFRRKEMINSFLERTIQDILDATAVFDDGG